ncbi:hypothetical protein PS876_04040 [Pseudomonas fluorescens]|uniref:hypothetical protein n=1 Tax=Pseudomonas fluorescens TaxID=294 RepID=UPI001240A3AE|nr:hypothetical protein [Pseudomonas fluorescens]VVP25156.1 hypothetical protein PS876_04040 [Pseudomonas fluorescens]
MQQVPPLAPPPPLNTHEVASGIARWAISRGLIEPLPQGVDDQYLANVPPIPFSNDAEQILRQKEIQSISYNHTNRMIYIYTKRKVTKGDLQTLPSNLQRQGFSYPQGHMDTVGKNLSSAQGAVFSLRMIPGLGATYACGSSISPGNDASAGTLGALVRLPDGLIYGLTNNHVSALCSHVAPETPILAPGVVDVGPGGIAPFTLGFHTRALEMRVGSLGNVDIATNLDAAVFRINNPIQVSSMQGEAFDTPLAVLDPVEGMRVEKVGRTTRHTKGLIVGRELRPLNVAYQAQSYGFNGVIRFANVFTIHGHNSEFSMSGDSGSLVVAVDDMGRPLGAVGLIFAGGPDSSAPGGAKSSMLPLRPILEALNATLVGGHNV